MMNDREVDDTVDHSGNGSANKETPSAYLLLPEDFFAIRQYVPQKASNSILYPLAIIVYIIAVLTFLYIFWLESNITTVETQFSSSDISDTTWTCSMASVISKTVDHTASQEFSLSYQISYDLVNINGLQDTCETVLNLLNPCSANEMTIALNSTTVYSIGGWMSSVTPYANDTVYMGITNDRVSPQIGYPFQVIAYNRRTGDITTLWGNVGGSFNLNTPTCSITYLDSLAMTYQPTQSLYLGDNGWIYLLASAFKLLPVHIDGVSHSSSFSIAQITNNNMHQLYALSYTTTKVGTITTYSFHIMQLSFHNHTSASYKTLTTTTTPIYSFTVYSNLTTNITHIYYTSCTGVYHWSQGVSNFLLAIPSSYRSCSDGANNFHIVNIQYSPYTQKLYLSNLNYPVEIDLVEPSFTSIVGLLTSTSSCYAFGGSVAVFADNTLMYSCDTFTIGGYTSVINSYNQLIYINAKDYSFTIVESGYVSTTVGWFLCDNTILSYLPDGLTREQSACELNGLAWRMVYDGSIKYFTTTQAKVYFLHQASQACSPRQLYSVIATSLDQLPPYLCSRDIATSLVTTLTTAIANTEALITLIMFGLGVLLTAYKSTKKASDNKVNKEEEGSKDGNTQTPIPQNTAKGINKYIDKLLPSQFYQLPYDPILSEKVHTLYLLTAFIVSICCVVFILLIVQQVSVSSTESNLSTKDISNDEWNCSMASFLTGAAYATTNIDPQTSYSFVNVNERYDECMDTLHTADPCAHGQLYSPVTSLPTYPESLAYQSPYSHELLFTGVPTNYNYIKFSMMNMTSGVMTVFDCDITGGSYPSKTVAHGPNNTGYYAPYSTIYTTIFNQDCAPVIIHNVPTNWIAKTVLNDQYYNVYAVSGNSLYRLFPNHNTAGVVTSFNASICLTVSSWMQTYVAVYLQENNHPVIYYIVSSSSINGGGVSTTLAKYSAGKTIQMTTNAYLVSTNIAVSLDGNVLYVLDSKSVLHCLNATSPTLATLQRSQSKSGYWISGIDATSVLINSGNVMQVYDMAANTSTVFQYTLSGTRIGWFLCGTQLMSTLPTSMTDGTSNCSFNGILWEIQYQDIYYLPGNTLQSIANASYQAQCNTTELYEQICTTIGQSPPYICSRSVYNSWSDVTSAAFANSHILFTILCFGIGVGLLVIKQMSSKEQSSSSMIQTVIATNVFLPNTFFRTSKFRAGKASRVILLICWGVITLLSVALFVSLVVVQYNETTTEVSVEITDISDNEWSCSMASKVTTEYSIALDGNTFNTSNTITNTTTTTEHSENNNINGRFFLVNINESYETCLSNLQQADPCHVPINQWQSLVTPAVERIDMSIYSSSYTNASNTLYFNNGLDIPFRYDLSNGLLIPNVNCPLASYLVNNVLIGSYVAISALEVGYFLGKYGLVTYDCEPVLVMNTTTPLFPLRSYIPTTTYNGAYLPGVPHLITNDNEYNVITCINSTYTSYIECYQLTFVNHTYAMTSPDAMIWSTSYPLTLFAVCIPQNTSSPYARYIVYRLLTVPGLYLEMDYPSGKSISYIITVKTVTWIQFDTTCDTIYYALSGTGIQSAYIPVFIHTAGASKTTIVPTTLPITFAFLPTSTTPLMMYQIFDNAAGDYIYMLNLTLNSLSPSSSLPGDIMYNGFTQSAMQWFVCANETIRTIPTPFTSVDQGVPYCSNNGISLQFQFDNSLYYYTQAMMKTYMHRTSEFYCANSQQVYDTLCAKVDQLPPYLCTREVRQSLLQIFSIGFANSTFVYSILITIVGLSLPWMLHQLNARQVSKPHNNLHSETMKQSSHEDTPTHNHNNNHNHEGDIELSSTVFETKNNSVEKTLEVQESTISVENPLRTTLS